MIKAERSAVTSGPGRGLVTGWTPPPKVFTHRTLLPRRGGAGGGDRTRFDRVARMSRASRSGARGEPVVLSWSPSPVGYTRAADQTSFQRPSLAGRV